jgi:outer membrane protein assembly factor BamB
MKPTPLTILLAIVTLLSLALLLFLAFNSINENNIHKINSWEAHVNGSITDIITGDNGTVYTFSTITGNIINAFDSNGTRKWDYSVPDAWRVRNVIAYNEQLTASSRPSGNLNDTSPEYWPAGFSYLQTRPVYAVDRGVLYVYVRENRTTYWNHGLNEDAPEQPRESDWKLHERLMAIAENGSLLWDVPVSDEHHVYEDTNVIAKDGRIYVFDDYAITVLGDNGSILFSIGDIAGHPAIDDDGNIYAVPAIIVDPQPQGLTQFYHDTGLKAPANALEAYDASGRRTWRTDIDGQVWRPGYSSLPIYQNDTLWVPVINGLQAFNTNGSLRWAKKYQTSDWPIWGGAISLYTYMPVDGRGNAYMYEEGTGDPLGSKKWYHIIAASGSETLSDNLPYAIYADRRHSTIIWTAEHPMINTVNVAPHGYPEVSGVPSVDMTAYDLLGNRMLWSQTIAPKANTTVLTIDSMDALLSQHIRYRHVTSGIFLAGISDQNPVSIIAGDKVLFVAYSWASYNAPIVLNWTQCIYGSQISAFDEQKGTLLWETPLNAMMTAVAARGNTVYYGTGDGRLFARHVRA